MKKVLYVEGSGPRRAQQAQCRRAFAKFFARAGVPALPAVEPCGGRKEAYDSYCRALRGGAPETVSLLLVDAEDPVAEGHTVWRHLRQRPGDNWERPTGASDDDAFLMVTVMETWLLADPQALARYFGPHFSAHPIRRWPTLEAVPKETVYDVLEKATVNCKQRYCKGDVSFDLLAVVDPSMIEEACPHAHTLLERLRKL